MNSDLAKRACASIVASSVLGLWGCDRSLPYGQKDLLDASLTDAVDASTDTTTPSTDASEMPDRIETSLDAAPLDVPSMDMTSLDAAPLDVPSMDMTSMDMTSMDTAEASVDADAHADADALLDADADVRATTVYCDSRVGAGVTCDVGGDACLQVPLGCGWFGNPMCCYAQCVCGSTPGQWDCSSPRCEGPGDTSGLCEGGSVAGTSEGSVVTDAQEPIRNLAVRAGYVYWSSWSGNVNRVPVGGGVSERLFTPDAQTTGPVVMALDNDAIYWHDQKQLYAMPIVGGAPRRLAASDDGATALFADASSTDLILGQDHGVAAVPKSGGALRSVRAFPLPKQTYDPSASLANASEGFIYTFEPEEHLINPDAGWGWQPWFTSALKRIAITGGSEETMAWMRTGGLVAVDGADLYWMQSSNAANALMRLSGQGGSPSKLSQWGYTHFLATDSSYIYLSTWEWQCKHQIVRSSKAGGDWKVLVAGISINRDLTAAIGSGKLFWVTGETGSVIRALDL